MRIAISGVVIALHLIARVAVAEVETVALAYEAPAVACPTRAELEAEIRARTNKVAFGGSGRQFLVRIGRGEAGFVGTLTIREGGDAPSERRIDGADCVEVASALGLIAALAIDPDAKTAPRAELVVTRAEPPADLPAPAPAPVKPSPRVGALARRPSEPALARVRWSVGLSSAVLVGPAPEWLVGLGPEAELARHASGGLVALGLSLRAAQTGTLGPSDARARFRFIAGRLALSPFGVQAAWRARVSALADLGALSAEGTDVDVAEQATELWFAAGVGGRLGRELGGGFYLDLAASALANATRDRFVFLTPHRTVHEVPFASFDAGISAGFSFP